MIKIKEWFLAGGINKSGMCHNFVIDRLNTAYDVYIYHNMKTPIFCIGGGSSNC